MDWVKGRLRIEHMDIKSNGQHSKWANDSRIMASDLLYFNKNIRIFPYFILEKVKSIITLTK